MGDVNISLLPIEKLIDVVSKGVGRLTQGYFHKKDVAAKAFEIKKIAEANTEAAIATVKRLNEAGIVGAKLTTVDDQ